MKRATDDIKVANMSLDLDGYRIELGEITYYPNPEYFNISDPSRIVAITDNRRLELNVSFTCITCLEKKSFTFSFDKLAIFFMQSNIDSAYGMFLTCIMLNYVYLEIHQYTTNQPTSSMSMNSYRHGRS